MEISISELVDKTLSGNYPDAVKFDGVLYYPDETNKTYVNIYGVNLWSRLIGAVEDGTPVSELKLEVFGWK